MVGSSAPAPAATRKGMIDRRLALMAGTTEGMLIFPDLGMSLLPACAENNWFSTIDSSCQKQPLRARFRTRLLHGVSL
jgi:hypothetical protein